jgi:hypothetical protein
MELPHKIFSDIQVKLGATELVSLPFNFSISRDPSQFSNAFMAR